MDFTGLNSNPVVFDTSANVRPVLSLEDEEDAVVDEVASALQRGCRRVPRVLCCSGAESSCRVVCRSTRWRSLT